MSREIVAVLRQNWILNEQFCDIHWIWTKARKKKKNGINHKPNLLLFNDKHLNRFSSVITLSVFLCGSYWEVLRHLHEFQDNPVYVICSRICAIYIYTHVYGNTNSTHFGIQVENICSPKETLFCGYYCRRHSTSYIFNTPKKKRPFVVKHIYPFV